MDQILFLAGMAIMVAGSLWWGFRSLPEEKWQIMAVLPRHKTGSGWQGLNLTYYGLLTANAYTFAVILFLILTTAARISLPGVCLFVTGLLAVCLPASLKRYLPSGIPGWFFLSRGSGPPPFSIPEKVWSPDPASSFM
jgi:hypothetical protein